MKDKDIEDPILTLYRAFITEDQMKDKSVFLEVASSFDSLERIVKCIFNYD